MAWSAPASAVAGVTATAAWFNQYVRDNLKAIGDPWTAYTPTWTASANPTLGNGTLTGKYVSAGKYVTFSIQLVTGSTTTYGTGAYLFSLPFTAAAGQLTMGDCILFDTSAASYYSRGVLFNTSTNVAIPDGGAGFIGPAIPFTFANGDKISISGTYEAA